jgi:hypothetical protein
MQLNLHQIKMVCSLKIMTTSIVFDERTRYRLVFILLEAILFAVTGGAQIETKKVYIIDAHDGQVLTSFESNPVNFNMHFQLNLTLDVVMLHVSNSLLLMI